MELFEEDVYRKEFDAQVISCTKSKKYYEVVLDQTLFFPEGGGQPSDIGTLNDIKVMDVQKKDGKIIHYTKSFLEGKVHGKIDWNHRFDLMQQHSGEHIVSGIVHSIYGFHNIGFHMSDVITIDFDGPIEDVQEIEDKANQAVFENVPFHIYYPTQEELKDLEYRAKKEIEEELRIVEIEGYDVCACCGTHVSHSGEIGMIKILSQEVHKDSTRLTMICGKRALQDYQWKQEQVIQVSQLLASRPTEIAKAVESLQKKDHEKSQRIGALLEKQIEIISTSYKEEPFIFVPLENVSMNELRNACDYLKTNNQPNWCMVLCPQTMQYALCAKDSKEAQKQLHEQISGKGGGSKEMVQGKLNASLEEVLKGVEWIRNNE